MITSPTNPTIKRVRALAAPSPSTGGPSARLSSKGCAGSRRRWMEARRPRCCSMNRWPWGARDAARSCWRGWRSCPARRRSAPPRSLPWPRQSSRRVSSPSSPSPPGRPPAPARTLLYLILDAIRDPGNLGTILRSAEAAGVTACWLTPDCVDLYNPKVVRAGAGVHFRLPCFVDQDWPQIRTEMARLRIDTLAALDAHGETPYYTVDWRPSAALIVGNEAHGLSPGALQAATARVAIPMRGGRIAERGDGGERGPVRGVAPAERVN